MELFQYYNILDEISSTHKYDITDERKEKIIRFHKTLVNIIGECDFTSICEQIVIESYLTEKYPNMGIYERIFGPQYIN